MPGKCLSFVALFSLLVSNNRADAEIAKKIQTELRGEIVVTLDPLPETLGDADGTLAAYKQRRVRQVPAAQKDGSPTWAFYYLAVMKEPAPSKTLGFDFYRNGKRVARKVVTGWDKRLTVLRGQLFISEDDGLEPGTYQVKLVGIKGESSVLLAKTTLAAQPLPAPEKTSQR